MALTTMLDGVEHPLGQGKYAYVVDVTGGAVTINVSADNGVSYQAMTDGVLSATGDGTIEIGGDFIYKATVPAGSSLTLSLAQTGYK